jgi:hypothetical protein
MRRRASITTLYTLEIEMAISARLTNKTQLALMRYCRTHGITQTQALERGIALLLAHGESGVRHPAFAAYERLRGRLPDGLALEGKPDSTEAVKRHLDEKFRR